jgi:hypothetical protein
LKHAPVCAYTCPSRDIRAATGLTAAIQALRSQKADFSAAFALKSKPPGGEKEDRRLAEEAGMVFPDAAAEEVEAETEFDELEAMSTARLRRKSAKRC